MNPTRSRIPAYTLFTAGALGVLLGSLSWRKRRSPARAGAAISPVLEPLQQIVLGIDARWRVVHANAGLERLDRDRRGPIVGRSLWERWPEMLGTALEDALRRAMRTRRTLGIDGFFAPAGRHQSILLLPANDGGLMLLGHDAVERSPPAQHSGEQRIREAIEAAQIGTILTEFNAHAATRIDWSPVAKRLFGLPSDRPVDEAEIMARVHPDDRTAVNEAIAASLRPDGDGLFKVEHRVVWPDGAVRWIAAHGQTSFEGLGEARIARRSVGIVHDVTGRREADARSFAIQRRLQSLMDAAPVGISFSTDTSCTHIIGNAEVFRQFQASSDQNLSASAPAPSAHGRRIQYFADGRSVDDRSLPLQRAVAENRQIGPIELEIAIPDGRRWFAETTAAPIHAADGEITGGVAVTVDITQRKSAEQALREADRRKDEFIAVLSHELRNPLTAVRNAAYMLKREDLPDARRELCLDMIERQVEVMSRLLEDLLDMSRIRHDRLELRRCSVSIRELVGNAAESMRPVFEAGHHQFTVELPAEDAMVFADPVRITQLLSNLLSNAARYTPPGGTIALRAGCEGDWIWVRVEDNGIGISPDWLPHLFDMFMQAPADGMRPNSGLGIGLSLVRAIAQLHGGSIEARSDGPGRGSMFELRLPKEYATEACENASIVAVR